MDCTLVILGDGDIKPIRPHTGEILSLMVPMKASVDLPHVLVGSVGPELEGVAVCREVALEQGDVIMAATDGVADRVGGLFCCSFASPGCSVGGEVDVAIDTAFREMCELTDSVGHVFDDNISLALLFPFGRPRFGPAFWSK